MNTTSVRAETGHATTTGFQDTQWTQILHKVRDKAPEAPQALEELCRIYWPPLYAYLRRLGRSPEDAQDLTQGFFVHLLAKDRLQRVERAHGKFRSFLLACLNNYVNNEWDKAHAEKRGGGGVTLTIEVIDAELRYGPEPHEEQDPALFFERRWARILIEQALDRLMRTYAAKREAPLFEAMRPFLMGGAERGAYGQVAARLCKSEGAVRVAVTRLRQEFRQVLRQEVGLTVGTEQEIDEEIRHLFTVFAKA